MAIYEIDGIRPVVHPSSYVHPEAVLIGDVQIGPGCYIGPLASLRGDTSLKQAVHEAQEAGRKYISVASQLLAEQAS